MQQDLALSLRLQATDRKIATLENEIAALPKHIAEIEKQLEAHTRRLEADRATLATNQRDRKNLEGEIQLHQQKTSKLRDQILQAKTNEQYKAFQNEISYIEGEIRKAEDSILDLMEKSEPLDANVNAAELGLKKKREHVDAEKVRAKDRTATDQSALIAAKAERKTIVETMAPKVYTDYERIRKKTKGSVVAEATDGRCDACHISLRPQFFQDLRTGNEVMYCESCGRMLIYNPAVDLSN